ncbi:MAG: hydrogenase maturation nickel metallochaperone HypA, partial [Anaerolineae bacterium]
MHELSVTENIISVVKRHAENAGAKRVTGIYLVIGELASIVDDCIQFYFDFLSRDTMMADAKLYFERVPIKLRCGACQHEWVPEAGDWTCPNCSAAQAQVIAGREFSIDHIE